MPYAIFQHSMTELLNAHLIDIPRAKGDPRFAYGPEASTIVGADFLNIPAPITAYFSIVANTITAGGDRLLLNLPEAGTPQGPINVQPPPAAAPLQGEAGEHAEPVLPPPIHIP